MTKKYGQHQYKTQPKPTSNPPAGFTQPFYDSENNGALTLLFPNGATQALAPLPFFIGGETTVAAGNNINIPDNFSIVRITAGAGGTTNNVSLPSAATTRFLFIHNGDATGTTGAVAIPAGKLIQLLAVGGSWNVVGFGTTL